MQAHPASPTRGAVALGVALLHALVFWAFIAAGRMSVRREPAEPVMIWLSWPDVRARTVAPTAVPAHRASAPHREAQPAPIVAPLADIPRPTAITPEADTQHAPIIDWNAAATDAARHQLAAQADAQRRDRSMGVAPQGIAPPRAPPPAFAWHRQPLGKHFDVERGVVTVRTKRCVFGVFVILPGFSCNPGRVDPEPGQGDLFDPKYAVPSLELPKPLVDDPMKR